VHAPDSQGPQYVVMCPGTYGVNNVQRCATTSSLRSWLYNRANTAGYPAPALLFPDFLPLHVDKVESFQANKGCSFYTIKKHRGGRLHQQVVAAAQEYVAKLEQACCDKKRII
jgi:hypothetical protein